MKLFVTGGAGFIGANFVLYWLSTHKNDSIINYDVLTYAGNLGNLTAVSSDPRYRFIQGDICSASDVRLAMKDADIVVHFAAESHVDRSIHEPAAFVNTNIIGTQVLLDAAVELGQKRFHHISTDEVFGSLSLVEVKKFSETTPYNPRSPYAASKASSDHLVRSYFYTYGLPITITNCSNNFGPYQFPEKFIPLAITNILEGKKVPVYGDGKNVRDWLYVEDHCRAIDAVIERGVIGETYCIGGMAENLDNITVVNKIITVMGASSDQIEFVTDRPGHDLRYAVDWSKAAKDLDWKPQHDFDTHLAQTVDWYKQNESWWKRVKSGEYQKYYKKQYEGRV